jgi:hypothetical protein
LLLRAGFEEGTRGEQLRLDRAIGTTTPDVIYRTVDHAVDEGVCIYLDGLSNHLHGNPKTADSDRRIRDWLRNNGYEVIEIAASDLYDEGAMTRHFRRLAGYLNKPELRERLRADPAWFVAPSAVESTSASVAGQARIRVINPRPEERYVRCLPLIPLDEKEGLLGDPQKIGLDSYWDKWVVVETGRSLRPGMFVAQVLGKSMEPVIADGAYCLFASPVNGPREGKVVVVHLRGQYSPGSGERHVIRRYESEQAQGGDSPWRRFKVTLHSANHEFNPIVIDIDDEAAVVVKAEFLETL